MNPQVIQQTFHQENGETYLFFKLNNCDVYVVYNNRVIEIGNVGNRYGIWSPTSFTAFDSFCRAFYNSIKDEASVDVACRVWRNRYEGTDRIDAYYNQPAWEKSFTGSARND